MKQKWQKTKVNPSSKLQEVVGMSEQVLGILEQHENELVAELKDLQARETELVKEQATRG